MSVAGLWRIAIKTPIGDNDAVLDFDVDGTHLTGFASGSMERVQIDDGAVEGQLLRWSAKVSRPFSMNLAFTAMVEGDRMSGSLKGLFGTFLFTGKRDRDS